MRKLSVRGRLPRGRSGHPRFRPGRASIRGRFHVEGHHRLRHVRASRTRAPTASLYGIGGGYDFRVGNAVLGIEGEASDSTADECVTTSRRRRRAVRRAPAATSMSAAASAPSSAATSCSTPRRGYTNARVDVDYDDGTAGTVADFDRHDNLDGIRVGGGVAVRRSARTPIVRDRISLLQLRGRASTATRCVGGLGFRF